MNDDEILIQSQTNARNEQLKSLNKPIVDTITTDSGKVLKLEQFFIEKDFPASNLIKTPPPYMPTDQYQRVWVLVEETE